MNEIVNKEFIWEEPEAPFTKWTPVKPEENQESWFYVKILDFQKQVNVPNELRTFDSFDFDSRTRTFKYKLDKSRVYRKQLDLVNPDFNVWDSNAVRFGNLIKNANKQITTDKIRYYIDVKGQGILPDISEVANKVILGLFLLGAFWVVLNRKKKK